ncbi:MAG: tetratricopeptide repeat protein, partial [Bacteroidales bacterium]|nr:tetratricopeptide repeat protein [Bacteroidales bacterium]
MKCMNKYIIFAFALLFSLTLSAQKAERKQIREGNKLYENEQYTEAEIAYLKALEVNPNSPQSSMNLGNALYRQQKAQEAL